MILRVTRHKVNYNSVQTDINKKRRQKYEKNEIEIKTK